MSSEARRSTLLPPGVSPGKLLYLAENISSYISIQNVGLRYASYVVLLFGEFSSCLAVFLDVCDSQTPLSNMDKGWFELESDPGLFTLLLEDFGAAGVQVEEIYDLQKPIEGPVYGFIFLFKWIEERRSRRKIIQEDESFVVDEEIVNSMFFAQQVIPNSCATHALLSVLLNCDKLINIGDALLKLMNFTQGMNAEDKGYAIGNMPELARAHNSHARPELAKKPEHQKGISAVRTMEAFHFVSYVPVNGRLFELDGLKPYPIDHGPWAESEEWTEKFRRVISERLGMATGGVPYHDIRFNLMAVVPDRRQQYEHKLSTLKTNRQIVLEALQQMVKVTSPEMEQTPGRGLRSKAEPIVTRSVAAREGIAHPIPGSPPSVRTRHKQKQAAAAAAANSNSVSTGSTSSATPSSVGSRATTPSPVLGRLPPGLDCHSYAKSPILKDPNGDDAISGIKMDGYEADRGESDNEMDTDGVGLTARALGSRQEAVNLGEIQGDQLTTVKDNAVKIEISVSDEKEGSFHMPTTVASTDVTKPLTIQTKFTASPGPSSESTDTASEVGSGMNSPVCSTLSGQASPNCPRGKIRGEEAIKAAEGLLLQHKLETGIFGAGIKSEEDGGKDGSGSGKLLNSDGGGDSETSPRSKFCSRQGFTPKDLLALLKNVENEISQTEAFLKDECEKRKKYKIDDCRRTHNYDRFVCTFLSMLAEQGHLAGLVEQHTSIKRRTGLSTISHLHKMRKPDKKKRPKPKKKR